MPAGRLWQLWADFKAANLATIGASQTVEKSYNMFPPALCAWIFLLIIYSSLARAR